MKISITLGFISLLLFITACLSHNLLQNYSLFSSFLSLCVAFILIPTKPIAQCNRNGFRYKWYIYNVKRGNKTY